MMKHKLLALALVLLISVALVIPAGADDIIVVSQPDEVYVFLNNIAYARDEIVLPGTGAIRLALSPQVYADTLILREDGVRVPEYRVAPRDGQLIVEWASQSTAAARTVTLEYLLSGLSWTPKYDMVIGDEAAERVDMAFFAQLQNSAFDLEDVQVHLIAGRVDTSSVVDTMSTVTTNQIIAGYEEIQPQSAAVGAATIQYIYEPGRIDAAIGDSVFVRLLEATLPARRLLVWNSAVERQVQVIYKVRNDSTLPLAEGVVRAYQDDIFIGSDFVEVTPIGGEGSITVGSLQDVRVSRVESSQPLNTFSDYDIEVRIDLTLESFAGEPLEIEVVAFLPIDVVDETFSLEPEREPGNLLRWRVTLEPGTPLTINYGYTTR